MRVFCGAVWGVVFGMLGMGGIISPTWAQENNPRAAVQPAQSSAQSPAQSSAQSSAGPRPREGVFAGLSLVDHIGADDKFNPFAPEVMVSYSLVDIKMRPLSLIGGVYYNGEYRASWYGGLRLDLDPYVDINLGVVRGYKGDALVPMALFEAHPWENFGLFFLPGAERVGGRLQFLPIIGLRATVKLTDFGG